MMSLYIGFGFGMFVGVIVGRFCLAMCMAAKKGDAVAENYMRGAAQ